MALRRYTLVFAEDRRGKTALCAILRPLCENAPAIILSTPDDKPPTSAATATSVEPASTVSKSKPLWRASTSTIPLMAIHSGLWELQRKNHPAVGKPYKSWIAGFYFSFRHVASAGNQGMT